MPTCPALLALEGQESWKDGVGEQRESWEARTGWGWGVMQGRLALRWTSGIPIAWMSSSRGRPASCIDESPYFPRDSQRKVRAGMPLSPSLHIPTCAGDPPARRCGCFLLFFPWAPACSPRLPLILPGSYSQGQHPDKLPQLYFDKGHRQPLGDIGGRRGGPSSPALSPPLKPQDPLL